MQENEAVYNSPELPEEEKTEDTAAPSESNPAQLSDGQSEDAPDYESIIAEDLNCLRHSFPELAEIKDITELENPTRYGALRDLGLSPEEAYRATSTRAVPKADNRSHLKSSAPRAASSPATSMSYGEMAAARELFGDISDAEIQRLFRKVTR